MNLISEGIFLFILTHILLIDGDNYKLMPDSPEFDKNRSISFDRSIVRRVYSFNRNDFQRLHIVGGPFNVKIYQNIRFDENISSLDVETTEEIHSFLSIEMANQRQMNIRINENSSKKITSNISLSLNYFQLNEIYLDGQIYFRCLNSIQSENFRLISFGSNFIKLKLNVQTFQSFLYSLGENKFCGYVHHRTTIRSFGFADVHAENLLTKKIDVLSTGFGNVFVLSIESMNITSTGFGHVYYRGHLNHHNRTGLGNLIQLEDVHQLVQQSNSFFNETIDETNQFDSSQLSS